MRSVSMRSNLALVAALSGLFTFAVAELPVNRAEACGVKLTVKPSSPRKNVKRTANPSPVLLVGQPPRRLERDLTVAGHNVEVVSNPNQGKRDNYAVVIVDSNEQAGAAQAKYPNSVIMVRS